jgi:hypothetical protein
MFYSDGLTPADFEGTSPIQININSHQQSLFVFDECTLCNLGSGFSDDVFVNQCSGIEIPSIAVADGNLYQFCRQLNITGNSAENRYIDCVTSKIRSANSSILIALSQSDVYGLSNCNFMSGLNPNDPNSYSAISNGSSFNKIHVLGSSIIYQGINNSIVIGNNSGWEFYRINKCNITSTSNITGATAGLENFTMNTIEAGAADGLDFTGSSTVYNNFGTTIYLRPDGTPKLRFYNDSDTLVIDGATA